MKWSLTVVIQGPLLTGVGLSVAQLVCQEDSPALLVLGQHASILHVGEVAGILVIHPPPAVRPSSSEFQLGEI